MNPPPVLYVLVVSIILTPLICAFIGQKRVGGVLLAVLIGLIPLLGILIVLLLPKKKAPREPVQSPETQTLGSEVDVSDYDHLLNPQYVTGEVVQVVNRDESYTYGGGGGGNISTSSDGKVSGYIAPTWIRTRIVKKDEVWLRVDSGKEVNYSFPRERFQCRAGHRLTIACLDGFLVAVRNHTTERDEHFMTIADWQRSHFAKLCPRFWSGINILIGIFFWPLGVYWLVKQSGVDAKNREKATKLWTPVSKLLAVRYQAIETSLKNEK
jgi:hypothetical protein